MALTDVFKSLSNGLNEEIKEFRSVLGRIRLTADSSAIGANYRTFGTAFGAYDFDVFMDKAREFYKQGSASSDPLFTIINMSKGRIAIDYDGETRGIYTRRGKPLAFFKPDFRRSGYRTKADELADFRHGLVLFS